jgi:hypothetical protein
MLAPSLPVHALAPLVVMMMTMMPQSLLIARKAPTFGFWEPGYLGIPLGLLAAVFLSVLAYYLLPEKTGLFRVVRDAPDSVVSELKVMMHAL